MIKVLYGNEPYLISQHVNMWVKKLNNKEMNYERIVGDDIDRVTNTLVASPFFDDFRVICIIPSKIDVLESIWEVATESSNVLLVQLEKIDERKKIYKNHSKDFVRCNKDDCYELLKKSIVNCFTKDAFEEYIRRIDYVNNDSVGYMSIIKEVEQLLCLRKPIDKITVENNIKEYVEQNVFGISGFLVKGDIKSVLEQLEVVKDAYSILPALFYQLKVAYKSKFFSFSEISARENPFVSLKRENIAFMLNKVNNTLRELKSIDVPDEILVRLCLTEMCVNCVRERR